MNNRGARNAPVYRGGKTANLTRPQAARTQRVTAPVAVAVKMVNSAPKFTSLRDGDIRVTHREYVADLNGSVAFASTAYAVNPGIAGTFPWLSGLARQYESYSFDKLSFVLAPQAPTSATGTVLLTADFDASDAAPDSKSQALAYRKAVRGAPWETGVKFNCLSEDLHKEKTHFVRTSALSSNQDIKLYDVANLFVCTQGQAGTTAVSEIWVEYSCVLRTPQMGSAYLGAAISAHYTGSGTNAAPFGTAPDLGSIPATMVSSGTTTSVTTWTFTQPWEGAYMIYAAGTGLTGFTPSGTGTEQEYGELINAGATLGMCFGYTKCDAGQTFVMTIANTTISSCVSWLAQANVA